MKHLSDLKIDGNAVVNLSIYYLDVETYTVTDTFKNIVNDYDNMESALLYIEDVRIDEDGICIATVHVPMPEKEYGIDYEIEELEAFIYMFDGYEEIVSMYNEMLETLTR